MKKELLHQALYALINGKKVRNFKCGTALQAVLEDAAIAALEAAIAQPVQPTPAEYAMGYAEGFNDACKPKSQPVQPHDLQKRLADLHLYEEITQYYAKCDPTPEALRDWVVERGAL